jgi:flagellar basal body rod protein FlgC
MNGYGHTKRQNCGYVLAYAPKHPKAHKDGYVMLHTVVMERHIGRYLKQNEVVHHINHDREDNRIENLKLMDKKDHMKMHMIERHEKRRNDLLTA